MFLHLLKTLSREKLVNKVPLFALVSPFAVEKFGNMRAIFPIGFEVELASRLVLIYSPAKRLLKPIQHHLNRLPDNHRNNHNRHAGVDKPTQILLACRPRNLVQHLGCLLVRLLLLIVPVAERFLLFPDFRSTCCITPPLCIA